MRGSSFVATTQSSKAGQLQRPIAQWKGDIHQGHAGQGSLGDGPQANTFSNRMLVPLSSAVQAYLSV